jgi:DNA-binding XRE family transcriptional regulator
LKERSVNINESQSANDVKPISSPPAQAEDAERLFAEGIGDAIRASRKVLGWTQADLAERAGLSPNYVARIERGEVSPSLWVTHRIASAMSTTLDALVVPQKTAPPLVRTKIARKFAW